MVWSFEISDRSQQIELGFPMTPEMPRVANVPPFFVATGLAHDDFRLADDSSGCSETVLIGTHAGTHVDGLAHVSVSGRVHGNAATTDVQTRSGVTYLDMTTLAPFVAPGFLIDLPARQGVTLVEEAIELGPEDLADALPGDLEGGVVLLRTGWGALWRADPNRFASQAERRPGLGRAGSAWLAARGVRAVGTDSYSIEVLTPSGERPATMPAHVELLVEAGVFVFEAMDLEALAAASATRFLFVALPLRLAGGSGSPVRPIAIL